jgi:hypothetical protein
MPKLAYADLIRDWESLIDAAESVAAERGDFEPYLGTLRQHLAMMKELKARQDSANATRQVCTQLLEHGTEDGKAFAISLRGAVRAKLGAYNERLVQFGMTPVRRRRGSRTPGEQARVLEDEPTPFAPEGGDLS